MKSLININRLCSYLAMAMISGLFAACTPDDTDAELAPAPTSEQVQFSATHNTDNPNIVTFRNETPGTFKAIWDFGNGGTAEGNQVEGAYAVEGDYTVTLTVFNSGGYAMNTKTINIAETNVAMLDREDYNFLTGGADNASGKTWVVDRHLAGHMGVGPIAAATPEWWSAPANDKASEGLYDDEMTFNLNGFAYTYNNNGDTFVNGSNAAGLGGTAQADDYTLEYTSSASMTWSMVEENGKKYLVISDKGFLGYYTGASRYEILSLTENELYLKTTDAANAANAWWIRLVPEGYEHPVEERPYEALELEENFDDESNITWRKEALTLNESYDNPAPVPINTSPKVAMYVKQPGQAYEYANMFADFDYDFDLNQNNVIRLKVFVPGYNDFTTADGESWANPHLLQQVSVKLQDGTSAEPWVNQVEIKQPVTELGQWVELEFDFSAYAERTDLNRVQIQIGGEGNFIPGIFFIDDIRVEE